MASHQFFPTDGVHGVYLVDSWVFETTYHHYYIGPVASVVVPKRRKTDFASIPRLLWWLFPPVGPYLRAALIHDELYRENHGSRAVADAVFLEVMGIDKVPFYQRWPLYLGVRLGGWWFWNRNKRRRGDDHPDNELDQHSEWLV